MRKFIPYRPDYAHGFLYAAGMKQLRIQVMTVTVIPKIEAEDVKSLTEKKKRQRTGDKPNQNFLSPIRGSMTISRSPAPCAEYFPKRRIPFPCHDIFCLFQHFSCLKTDKRKSQFHAGQHRLCMGIAEYGRRNEICLSFSAAPFWHLHARHIPPPIFCRYSALLLMISKVVGAFTGEMAFMQFFDSRFHLTLQHIVLKVNIAYAGQWPHVSMSPSISPSSIRMRRSRCIQKQPERDGDFIFVNIASCQDGKTFLDSS
ncbi:MAG: hypothetical protein R2941_02125 [Desulfobacterales bacterium]